MGTNKENINQGFSSIYPEYDSLNQFEGKAYWQREKVYAHLNNFLKSSDSILEINAGSGIDAVYLAKKGNNVLATDMTDGFEKHLTDKLKEFKLQDTLSFKKLSYEKLHTILPQKFDYIFSNFGGLNCVENPAEILISLSNLLNKNGKLTVVIMPKHYPGEWISIITDRKKARRRYQHEPILASVNGKEIKVWYHPLKKIKNELKPNYNFLKSDNVGVLFPKGEYFGKKHPFLFSIFSKINVFLSWITPSGIGDYYIVTFQKK